MAHDGVSVELVAGSIKERGKKVAAHLATLRERLNRRADETLQALLEICSWQQEQLAFLDDVDEIQQGWQNEMQADVTALKAMHVAETGKNWSDIVKPFRSFEGYLEAKHSWQAAQETAERAPSDVGPEVLRDHLLRSGVVNMMDKLLETAEKWLVDGHKQVCIGDELLGRKLEVAAYYRIGNGAALSSCGIDLARIIGKPFGQERLGELTNRGRKLVTEEELAKAVEGATVDGATSGKQQPKLGFREVEGEALTEQDLKDVIEECDGDYNSARVVMPTHVVRNLVDHVRVMSHNLGVWRDAYVKTTGGRLAYREERLAWLERVARGGRKLVADLRKAGLSFHVVNNFAAILAEEPLATVSPEARSANELVLHPTGHCTCGGEGDCDWCRTPCSGCGEARFSCACERLHRPGEWWSGAPREVGCYEVEWSHGGGVTMMVVFVDNEGTLYSVCPNWVSAGKHDYSNREMLRHRRFRIRQD